MARISTRVSVSGASAWLNALQPASVNSIISVSSAPFKSVGQRTDREHARLVQRARAVLEHLHQARLIQRRIGIGRTGQRGHPARHRRIHLGFQRGLVFVARLAQARGNIDQTGHHDQAGGIDHLLRHKTLRRLADRSDALVGDEHILLRIDLVLRVDQATILDMNVHFAPAKVLITAMRTAIPKVTCGRMTDCVPSATLESISTPRFIGPGCITMASLFASASRSCVRP